MRRTPRWRSRAAAGLHKVAVAVVLPAADMHALQAESEIFRRGECHQEEEEQDYEEYQRRMRAAAKAKAPARNRPAKSQPVPAREPTRPISTQETLEAEHATRVAARERLEEREARLDAVFSETLSGESVQVSEPVSVEQLRGALKDNELAAQEDAKEFVGAYR